MEQTTKERILIVDDTPANIDVLGAMLMDYYEINVAINGPMALEIAETELPPDLILLDIMMPGMDGYEVARQLKSNPVTKGIPIIFVTAKIEQEDEAFGFALGAVDYIRKPVSTSVTLARIKSQLELKQYRDNLTAMVEQKIAEVKSSKQLLRDTEDERIKIAGDLKHSEESAYKNLVYFRELFMNSPNGIILVGTNRQIIRANQSFATLMGCTIEETTGTDVREAFIAMDCRKEWFQLIERAMEGETLSLEIQCYHKKGFNIPVAALTYPVTINNNVEGIFVLYENISQRKNYEDKLKHHAFHDALTGIPNRVLLMDRLNQAIELKRTIDGFNFSVFLLDLDRFKSINDSLGHQAGDTLLIAVTARIQFCLRPMDTIARLGGDEFAILLHNIQSPDQVVSIAERIRKSAETLFVIDGHEAHISASIGIVIDTELYETGEELIRDADLAMYHAKDAGKGCYKIFSPTMHDKAMESLALEKELRNAVENSGLELYYQPIINIESMELEGFEALIRWNHPCYGLVTPDQFIPLAEETGLIIPMGEWIIKSACQQLKQWKDESTQGQALTLSINVSIKQFLQENFVNFLFSAVSNQGLSPMDIKIELTESLLMAHTDSAVKKLQSLRERGFFLVLDDFGTGYSSLSYLQQFPIDTIKIDRSFISSLEVRKESVEIVKAIISMSKSLGMSVVAEGVEKEEQFKILAGLACDSAQGFLFAKPLDSDAASRFVVDKETTHHRLLCKDGLGVAP
ncbi:MAG: EAL domain-containing protein [Desulfobacterium sp.]